ncbi:hypothetical protein DITRI_Ditri16bG0100000 [Diplodiscus trichospermus]
MIIGSGKELLYENGEKGVTQRKSEERTKFGSTGQTELVIEVKEHFKEVNFDTEIPKVEMEWFQRSAIGQVRDFATVVEMIENMVEQSVKC